MELMRLKQALDNLKLLEKNCSMSKMGFEPTVVVCMYLTECIKEVCDIYPTKILRQLNVSTSFDDSKQLLEYLDSTIQRCKRVEHYAIKSEEIPHQGALLTSSVFSFLFDPSYETRGQLETFLVELHKRLNMIHEITSDPRRSKAKISYLERTFNPPLIQIASILEALSVGIANV